MINRRTGIGIGIGIVISAIGLYAFVSSFGVQSVSVDEKLAIGESTSFKFNVLPHTNQTLNLTGEAFHVVLKTPGRGLQVDEDLAKDVSFAWVILKEGQVTLDIQNTGQSEVSVLATFNVLTDPILFTYHIVVIIAGMVIIGVSAWFSGRKPLGF